MNDFRMTNDDLLQWLQEIIDGHSAPHDRGVTRLATECKAEIERLQVRINGYADANVELRALLVEVYNHGENSELHRRIGAALGAAPGEDASPSEPCEQPPAVNLSSTEVEIAQTAATARAAKRTGGSHE